MPGYGPYPTSWVCVLTMPRNPREALVDLRVLLRVGVLPPVPEQVPARQALAVRAVDGVTVPVAALVGVEQPAPADLVLEPVDVPALDDDLAVQALVLADDTRGRVVYVAGDHRPVPADTEAGCRSSLLKEVGSHCLTVDNERDRGTRLLACLCLGRRNKSYRCMTVTGSR